LNDADAAQPTTNGVAIATPNSNANKREL